MFEIQKTDSLVLQSERNNQTIVLITVEVHSVKTYKRDHFEARTNYERLVGDKIIYLQKRLCR